MLKQNLKQLNINSFTSYKIYLYKNRVFKGSGYLYYEIGQSKQFYVLPDREVEVFAHLVISIMY